MEDIKALKRAKYYMAAMADGINPLTGEYAEKDDTISQEKVQECCAYISELLNKIIENGGLVQKKETSVFDNAGAKKYCGNFF